MTKIRKGKRVKKVQAKLKDAWVKEKKLLTEFAYLTTCHGFRQIVAFQRRGFYRIAWAVVVLGLFIGLIDELHDKLAEYTGHSTVTDLHEEYPLHLEFPAITICSVNRFQSLKDELDFAKLGALAQESIHTSHKEGKESKWQESVYELKEKLLNKNRRKYVLSEEFKRGGWILDDSTLRHCAFEKMPCTIANFTPIVTRMGMCYQFKTNSSQTIPGGSHGLELYMDINQFEYTRDHNQNLTSGVKIIIHDQRDPPLVEKFSPSISTGHTGHIAISKTVRHLMYKPWGPCLPYHKQLTHYAHYSMATCMEECTVRYVIKECNCKPFWDHMFDAEECDAEQILRCAGRAEADFPVKQTAEQCNCTFPCSFTTYEASSTSIFPSIEIEEFLATHAYRNFSEHVHIQGIDDAFAKLQSDGRDHVMLDIFYDRLSFTSITQRKSVNEISLMSDVGGLLGLWLGISFVTIGEFIQLAIDFTELWIGTGKKKKRSKDINELTIKQSSLARRSSLAQTFRERESEEEDENTDDENEDHNKTTDHDSDDNLEVRRSTLFPYDTYI